jgi:LysR family hydrogen peroxide-inducible transcriptional activator
MEIHQLTYFVAVAETASFSRAASRCSISQPSLSQQIKKLEGELGAPLFDRMGRKTTLTQAGRLLLPRAIRILDELQRIKFDLKEGLESGRGELKVGFIPTIAPFVLPRVIHRFSQELPEAALEVHEGLTEELIQKIIDTELDVAITSLPIHNDLIQTEELLSEPLFVATSPKYEIANQASIRVKDLDNFPFIALSEVHCLGEQVQSFCYQKEVNLNVVCHTNQLSTVQKCITLGLGISLVPQALAVSEPLPNVCYRPISDAHPHRKIAAATHIRRTQFSLLRHFIEIVRSEYPTQ